MGGKSYREFRDSYPVGLEMRDKIAVASVDYIPLYVRTNRSIWIYTKSKIFLAGQLNYSYKSAKRLKINVNIVEWGHWG